MKDKSYETFFNVIILSIVLLIFLSFTCFVLYVLIDAETLKEVGEESVPCIDRDGNPFEDEMCTDTVHCSIFAFYGDIKCKDVKEGDYKR